MGDSGIGRSGGTRPEKRKASAVRIYCAGPLFNRAEQAEMAEIAAALEGAGFAVFLPQRDGLVFVEIHREMLRGGFEHAEAAAMIQRAVFWLDAYQVIQACDGILVNLNGRVPDEGAVAEAAMAWMAGKALVLYRGDARSPLLGQDNPLLAGLGGFARVATVPEIAYAFLQIFRARRAPKAGPYPPGVRSALEAGRRLAKALAARPAPAEAASLVVALCRPAERHPRR
jgi:nucleoside 2-deoxyribosyltransferase